MTGHLLDEPHHDGSPVYVDEEAPALGTNVTVRCRTAATDKVREVWIRTTKDAEPTFHPCLATQRDGAVWWEGGCRCSTRRPTTAS